ncbi:MAG: L-histidine N(alpha)-methyltransferase [Candidatus Kapabacteria bacterium]|jgi:dimethylhistidine N-methyltransferase|nr:L-histidine N(alpha)-methyltransferase [Candidatus Kapabacteria bacterium]
MTPTTQSIQPLVEISFKPSPILNIGANFGPPLSLVNIRGDEHDSLQTDVLRGLLHEQKYLLPKYLYDQRGSELFEEITVLPEYYLTRAEQEILDNHASEIIRHAEAEFWLIELGAGSGKKTRRLLQTIQERTVNYNGEISVKPHIRYMPIDISEEFLYESSLALQRDFPTIPMQPVCAEFLQGVEYIVERRNQEQPSAQLLIYFPGSTIGNLTREEASAFVLRLRSLLQPNDAFLLAADMNHTSGKNLHILHEAYNDADGITAAFNLNILHRINRELCADIPLDAYKHCAYYNAGESRVELFVESTRYHSITIDDCTIPIAAGERIHTEFSHKFSEEMIRNMAALADFSLTATWTDSRKFFGLYWLCAC